MKSTSLFVSLILSLTPLAYGQLDVVPAFPDLSFEDPVDIQQPGDGTNRLFVIEKPGRIRVFTNDPAASTTQVFLNLTDSVDAAGEQGLLGLAFHQNYASNGHFYVYYSVGNPRRNIISRFTVSSDPDSADADSEQRLMQIPYPSGRDNHNAGSIQFGPDGYLYIATGDGGGSGDPEENGQDLTTLLGAVLRVDVDNPDPDTTYGIPSGNPFDTNPTARDEIYAYGFRNPWRMSFDGAGRLWIGDVGQQNWEEIDTVQVTNDVDAGKNYGWDCLEGTNNYELTGCDVNTLEPPVFEYEHDQGVLNCSQAPEGGCSITGGYVYTGPSCAAFFGGQYVYADYRSKHIWALDPVTADTTRLVRFSGLPITSFGVDAAGELYFTNYSTGTLHRFDCTALPIELTAFNAEALADNVALTWTTASETDNAGFELQHSVATTTAVETYATSLRDGGTWRVLATIDGYGTTTQSYTYRYDVHDLAPGLHRFRLKQIDTDGTATYSEVVEVQVEVAGAAYLSKPYPNPVKGSARFEVALKEAQTVQAEVLDVLGRRVRTLFSGRLEAGRAHALRFEGADLPGGTYLVRVVGETFSATRRVTVLR